MHPISEILCRTYEVLLKNREVSFPLSRDNRNALDSVVKTVNSSYFGMHRFPTLEDKAVAYLCHLVKRHALTDGNKRLALLWFEVYTEASNLKPTEPYFGYDALAISIERTRSEDLDETIRTIKDLLFKA